MSYDDKSDSLRAGNWEEDVASRLSPAGDGLLKATVQVFCTADSVTYTICDHGKGFEWTKYLKIDPGRALDSPGRGVAMAAMGFDRLEYQGNGNTVVVCVERSKDVPTQA